MISAFRFSESPFVSRDLGLPGLVVQRVRADGDGTETGFQCGMEIGWEEDEDE